MRIVVIAKPPSDGGGLEELEEAIVRLRSGGHDVRTRVTQAAGEAAVYARGAAHSECDLLIAMGGDGTINDVVNGIAPVERRPRLGIIPAGTANDLARGLGLPETLEGALDVALHGCEYEMDAAQVNERWFANVSTGGFAAAITRSAGAPSKRRLGALAYALSGLRQLRDFAPEHARFEADGRTLYEGAFAFFAVGNSWRTGGGTRVTPRADPSDGLLDAMVVGDVSKLELLRLLPDLRRGTHLQHPAVHYVRARRFTVKSDSCLAVNADGEAVPCAELEYEVFPGRLRMMVPC